VVRAVLIVFACDMVVLVVFSCDNVSFSLFGGVFGGGFFKLVLLPLRFCFLVVAVFLIFFLCSFLLLFEEVPDASLSVVVAEVAIEGNHNL
jgi:hypothetical protein